MILFDPRSGEYVTFDLPLRPAERLRRSAISMRIHDREAGSRTAPQPQAAFAERTSPASAREPALTAGHADPVPGQSL
jgi:hypothetical protein